MLSDIAARLRAHGVQPSAQRVAVAEFVLETDEHPSADEVFRGVRARFPMVSRATVYNTLNLLVEKRLLREVVLSPGNVRFDPMMEQHHHFIDDRTGRIFDVPWSAVEVKHVGRLEGFEVKQYEVVMRGRAAGKKLQRK
ncbi:MAG TPA: Fur family transcriptional regulator [Polyangia bacterium]|nr:Fur family transcriptional regulator [Polyangia bacterium]